METGTTKTVTLKDLNRVSKNDTTYSVFEIEIEQDGKVLKGKTLTWGIGTECKFKEGQQAEFTKEPDRYKEGCYEFKWGEAKKAWSGGGRAPENPKIRNISFAMSYAKDLVVANLDHYVNLKENADMILKWMNDKIDEINKQ